MYSIVSIIMAIVFVPPGHSFKRIEIYLPLSIMKFRIFSPETAPW